MFTVAEPEVSPLPEVLPLQILQKQTCSECFNYLTVLPVTENKNGEIFCGRHKNSSSAVKSMFNTVMEYYTFKCINHFEGCKKMLVASNSNEHEKECNFEPHECPFCSFKGIWSQVLQHSLIKHPLNVTRDCKFNFKIGTESTHSLLHDVIDTIYLFKVDITLKKFRLTTSALAKKDLEIKQFAIKFSLYPSCKNKETSLADYYFFDNRSKSYFEKNIEELIFYYGLGTIISCQMLLDTVELSERELELEKRIRLYNDQAQALFGREKSLNKLNWDIKQQKHTLEGFSNLFKKLCSTLFKCSNCNTDAKDVIYFCPQNHCYCEKCHSSSCKICNDICELTKILKFDKIVVSCDWPQCRKSVSYSNYFDHSRSCIHRPYKCPIRKCTDVIYSIEALSDHWHYYGVPLSFEKFIEFNTYGRYERYWVVHNDLYHVTVKFELRCLQIVIEDSDVLSNPLKFKLEGYTTSTNPPWGFLNTSTGIYLNGKYVLISQATTNGNYGATQIRISVL